MSGLRILIVDDEPHVARVLRLTLERAGYLVETACNGEEGLKKFIELMPDGLLTDVRMPRMSGRELVLSLTRQFGERSFPIMVMTSSIEREHREWIEGVQNLYFLEKPVSPRKVVELLGEHFSAQPGKGGE